MSKDSPADNGKTLLSIIIPAYNASRTLRRCVESVLLQKVDSMEVVIVDDGSVDSTAEIAAELQGSSGKVKVISRSNGGLSAARNTGIEAVTGELITFVDSDDWLLADTYPPLLRMMEEDAGLDILEYSLLRHDGQKELCRKVFAEDRFTSGRDYWLRGRGYNHCYACNKIFRRHVFFDAETGGLRFREGRAFEDVAFIIDLLPRDYTIVTVPHMGYVYYLNPDGITGTASAEEVRLHLETLLNSFWRILNLEKTSGSVEEDEFYMAMLDVQIVAYHLSRRPLQLPSRKVAISRHDWQSPVILVKKFILNTFGARATCRFFSLFGCRGKIR